MFTILLVLLSNFILAQNCTINTDCPEAQFCNCDGTCEPGTAKLLQNSTLGYLQVYNQNFYIDYNYTCTHSSNEQTYYNHYKNTDAYIFVREWEPSLKAIHNYFASTMTMVTGCFQWDQSCTSNNDTLVLFKTNYKFPLILQYSNDYYYSAGFCVLQPDGKRLYRNVTLQTGQQLTFYYPDQQPANTTVLLLEFNKHQ